MCFHGQTFRSVFEQFSFTSKFFGLKMQKSTSLKKKMRVGFIFFFFKLTFRLLQTGLSDLKKHQTIETLLIVDFLRIFKMLYFSKIFENF